MVIYTGSIYHPIFLYAKLMHHLCKAHYSTNFTCDFNWFSISTFSMCTITWKQTCTFMVHSCFFLFVFFCLFCFFFAKAFRVLFLHYIFGVFYCHYLNIHLIWYNHFSHEHVLTYATLILKSRQTSVMSAVSTTILQLKNDHYLFKNVSNQQPFKCVRLWSLVDFELKK